MTVEPMTLNYVVLAGQWQLIQSGGCLVVWMDLPGLRHIYL